MFQKLLFKCLIWNQPVIDTGRPTMGSSSSMMLQIQRSKVGVSTIQIQIDSIQYRFIKVV
ncbi:hypothetical protein HanXRQr2_Chr11g0474201 [Helianthus annuus]|uniref:Uncharacterized protein n=1 Tax=Helianthus annuus TaxID=4232 RepID=A0A9K3HLY9_HELAN|nr:hypothetical protein HanXRQr2_Chr11g0474201 [Helianthus annuus]